MYSSGYSSTTKFVQMMILGWLWPFLWHGQICFLMLLHGYKLIQLIVMYFQACSNSTYLMHSGDRYRTIGPLVLCCYWKLIRHASHIPVNRELLIGRSIIKSVPTFSSRKRLCLDILTSLVKNQKQYRLNAKRNATRSLTSNFRTPNGYIFAIFSSHESLISHWSWCD